MATNEKKLVLQDFDQIYIKEFCGSDLIYIYNIV